MIDKEKIFSDYDGRPIVSMDLLGQPGVQRLLKTGYHLKGGKITPALSGQKPDGPWLYTRPHPLLNCTLWHEIMFSALGIFPHDCLSCWKVVVRPRTVKELVFLRELQLTETTRFCKCGTEVRDYVPAHYGGYFYNQGKEEGLECLDEVRGLVADNIGPDVPVFLKRYCTEFELKFGPSDQVEETLQRGYFIHPEEGRKPVMSQGDMQMWRAAANRAFEIKPSTVPCECGGGNKCSKCNGIGRRGTEQPPMVVQHVIRGWFEFAWKVGDMSVKEFFGGESLYTPSVTYE